MLGFEAPVTQRQDSCITRLVICKAGSNVSPEVCFTCCCLRNRGALHRTTCHATLCCVPSGLCKAQGRL